MKNLIQLKDYTASEIQTIYEIACRIDQNEYINFLKDKTILLFFPDTSIRTRITFEKGINLLGGKTILFPSETLDKKEEIKDVIGYLNNWVDAIIVRHPNRSLLDEMAKYSKIPIINAMTTAIILVKF